jgi:transposase
MTTHTHIIELSQEELSRVHTITHKGAHHARTILRARVLLLSHTGKSKNKISHELTIDPRTVQRIRDRYRSGGIDRALFDAPRPGQPRKLDSKGEAHLIALACSDPPKGRAKWTLELLAEHMVRDKKVESISDVCILSYLTQRNVKPWREKNVVHPHHHTDVHCAHGRHTHLI